MNKKVNDFIMNNPSKKTKVLAWFRANLYKFGAFGVVLLMIGIMAATYFFMDAREQKANQPTTISEISVFFDNGQNIQLKAEWFRETDGKLTIRTKERVENRDGQVVRIMPETVVVKDYMIYNYR
jgi:hypothetical protein